ncbi:RidA family protein [Shewanella dokdonensis]|uniref:RidA family protein n=1 Tax=Shewanella dokdonensis TaxID=712036 RepID=A0ABX8DDJ7_9GAMM|nr:RidA family protein [Shewanella dokdonensis]MCL1074728.1 RidA family protein [Shewanella dokdonensis]QVK22296.1 RidA family protein [Shewanella dokdonensis]
MKALIAMLALLGSCSASAASPVFYPAPGAPFSKAVRAGDTLYLSGMIGATADGKLPSDFASQIQQLLENIKARTAALGLSMDDLVKCTVMLDDMGNWSQFNKIYMTYFKPDHLPARSAFAVSGLALGAAAEMECIAYVPAEAK